MSGNAKDRKQQNRAMGRLARVVAKELGMAKVETSPQSAAGPSQTPSEIHTTSRRRRGPTPKQKYGLLAAGIASFVGLLAVQGVVIPPWIGMMLWLISALLIVYGLTVLHLPRFVYGAFVLLTIFLAYALWQASAPHADIHITEFRMVPRDHPMSPYTVAANVVFENRGRSDATVTQIWAAIVSPVNDERTLDLEAETVEAQLRQIVAKAAEGVAQKGITLRRTTVDKESKGQFSVVSQAMPTVEKDQFYDRNGYFVFAGELQIKDWWFVTQKVSFCAFTRAKNDVFLNCATP